MMSPSSLIIPVDIEEVIQMPVRMTLSAGKLSKSVLLRLEHPKYDHTRMNCQLTGISGTHEVGEIFAGILRGQEEGVFLESTDHPAFKCQLWAIQGSSSNATSVLPNAHWYEMGFATWDDYDLPDNGEVFAMVDLAPSDILGDWGVFQLHYNGTIQMQGGTKGKVSWRVFSGRAEALQRFVYEDGSVASNKARVQIARPSISFTLKVSEVDSPWAAFELIKKELKDVCRLLSFCYRRKVDWYDIKLMVRSKSFEQGVLPMPRCRKALYKQEECERIEPLIDRRTLVKGGFETLLRRYRASNSSVLDRVIAFLVAAHSPGSLETRFFLCQAALEGLTNCLIQESGRKFSDFKSLSEKLDHCVEHFNIPTEDLWKEAGFTKGLNSALKHRNRLFHGGGVEDLGGLFGNLVRLRALTERLLIARLKWPEDKLWPHRDEDLHSLIV